MKCDFDIPIERRIQKMKSKFIIPLALILIFWFAYLFAQSKNKIKNILQNPSAQNEVIQTIINNPEMMQNFMNHMSSNSGAMNNMMAWMLNNRNARQMMMNEMFSRANRDSSFTNNMYNMMGDYPRMYGWMHNMMSGNGNMRYNMMGGTMINGGMMGRGKMGGMMNNSNSNYGNSSYGNINSQTSSSGENWEAPASANNLTSPIKDIEKASREGKNIFNAQCFTCHGTDAKGNGPIANTLNPRPADLTSHAVQNQSDGALYWKITHGNPPMPAFNQSLSDKQRWDLVAYIRSLK